jgi:hypothetical protein
MDGEMLKMNIIPDMDDLLDQLEAQENNNEDHNKSTSLFLIFIFDHTIF